MKTKSVLLLIASILFLLPAQAQDKPKVEIGGALRFNYNYSDWKPDNKKRGGDFGFDLFRLNVKASYNKLLLDGEYRFYPSSSGGGMLKYGWIGYEVDKKQQIQVGLTQVPFGILPYTSNNYFFNINYYLGLEDDADMGIKYMYRHKSWDIAFAFFKNSDLLDFSEKAEISPDRYAYDIAGRNKEVNQLNARLAYNWGNSLQQQLGASAMLGGVYNLDTEKMGSHTALALHYTLDYRNWNLKAQYTTYRIKPRNQADEDRQTVSTAAFGAPYFMASEADTYMASVRYTLPINKGILDNIQFYNDFSLMDKREKTFKDSYQNVTGCLLTMGHVYTYIDYAMGKNHAWLGSEWAQAFARGGENNDWSARLNVNIGYYF